VFFFLPLISTSDSYKNKVPSLLQNDALAMSEKVLLNGNLEDCTSAGL
jgi:hypothetical protein